QATHIGANLWENDQGGALFNTLNGRQIDTRQAIEGGAGIEAWFIGFLVATGFRGQGLAMAFVREGAQMGLNLLIAQGQLLVIELIQIDSLPYGKEMLGAPGALQALGKLVLTMLTFAIA